MGDMAELGSDTRRLHADVGALARRSGIQRLFATGANSRAAVDAFGAGARHFEDQAALVDAARAELRAGIVLLVKGSRSAAMDRVVAALGGGAAGNGGARDAA
jgi:UDP-N-acetylmuramoyl-tripeptide--D-alanyl-D-alanine ligase